MEDTKPTTEQPSAAAKPAGPSGGVTDFILTQMERLPRSVREHLASAAVIEAHNRAYDAANLTEGERGMAYALELQVFFGLVYVEDFPALLLKFLATAERDDEKIRLLALEILGRSLLPAEAFLGGVVETITDLDGDPSAYDVKPLELERMTFGEGARKIAAALPVAAEDEASVTRLRHIIESYLRGVRDEGETKEMLMRQRKVGGLELSEADAEEAMHIVLTKAKLSKFVETLEESGAESPEPKTESAASPAVPGLVPADLPTSAVPEPSELPLSSAPEPEPEPEDQSPAAVSSPIIQPPTAPVSPPIADQALQNEETKGPTLDPAAVKAIYNGTDEEHEGLVKRVAKFREVTGEEAGKEHDAFHEIIYPSDLGPIDPLFVVAALFAMAEDGALVGALSDDLRYREMLTRFFADKGEQGRAFRFAEKPGAPEFMNVFLQLLLRGFAGFSEPDSARFGLRVVNYLKKVGFSEYAGLVVFDADLGAFRWVERVEL